MLTPQNAFPYYAVLPSTYKYMPTSMLQNSVSSRGSFDVMESLKWLNSNFRTGSCLLVHESFTGWSKLYLTDSITAIPYNLSSTVPQAAASYYESVYLIWWARNITSHEWTPPSQFIQIHQNGEIGEIAIFEYVNNSNV